MQTNLAAWAQDSELGKEAEEILRRCVHCGFCLATCPTYQITGDERDSPRGRIYLIKQVLEGHEPTEVTQSHLDKCLTCRNCETTCPSGVMYGQLVDIGREFVEERVPRKTGDKLRRAALRKLVTSTTFGPALKAGRVMKPLLPASLKSKIPDLRPAGQLPQDTARHERQVLILIGCVQPDMAPSIDAATIRVLDKLGIGVRTVAESGCCGAVSFHTEKQEEGRDFMRRNIDAWLPLLESGEVEAVVMNASGCGAMVKEYDHHLRFDPEYAEKAKRLVEKVVDIAELIEPEAETLRDMIGTLPERPVFHCPCTLQHWQPLRPRTEKLLVDLGFKLQPFNESHLCCGAAGAYSMLQPEMSEQLRDRKIGHIAKAEPDAIVSSNMGCINQLQSATDTPVRHWIEVVDAAL